MEEKTKLEGYRGSEGSIYDEKEINEEEESPSIYPKAQFAAESPGPLLTAGVTDFVCIPPIDIKWNVDAHLHHMRNFTVPIMITSIGGAAPLSKSKFQIVGTARFEVVGKYLKKALKRQGELFVYVNNFIMPQPDEFVADLYNVFAALGVLRLSYSYSIAY